MVEKTQRAIIQELYQAVVGIPENPKDNGLLGSVDEIKELLKIQNSRVSKNEARIGKLWGVITGLSVISTTTLGLIIKQVTG